MAVVALVDTKVRPVGADRTVVALKSEDVAVPAELIAVILNVYVVLELSPLIVKLL